MSDKWPRGWGGDRGWQTVLNFDKETWDSPRGKKLFQLRNNLDFGDFETEEDFLKMKKNAANLERAIKNSKKLASPLKQLAEKENAKKAIMKIGAPLGAAAAVGEAAKMKAAQKGLGFLMMNPWLAAMLGILTPMRNTNQEYIGSPHHQQWLARKGPLAK